METDWYTFLCLLPEVSEVILHGFTLRLCACYIGRMSDVVRNLNVRLHNGRFLDIITLHSQVCVLPWQLSEFISLAINATSKGAISPSPSLCSFCPSLLPTLSFRVLLVAEMYAAVIKDCDVATAIAAKRMALLQVAAASLPRLPSRSLCLSLCSFSFFLR